MCGPGGLRTMKLSFGVCSGMMSFDAGIVKTFELGATCMRVAHYKTIHFLFQINSV